MSESEQCGKGGETMEGRTPMVVRVELPREVGEKEATGEGGLEVVRRLSRREAEAIDAARRAQSGLPPGSKHALGILEAEAVRWYEVEEWGAGCSAGELLGVTVLYAQQGVDEEYGYWAEVQAACGIETGKVSGGSVREALEGLLARHEGSPLPILPEAGWAPAWMDGRVRGPWRKCEGRKTALAAARGHGRCALVTWRTEEGWTVVCAVRGEEMTGPERVEHQCPGFLGYGLDPWSDAEGGPKAMEAQAMWAVAGEDLWPERWHVARDEGEAKRQAQRAHGVAYAVWAKPMPTDGSDTRTYASVRVPRRLHRRPSRRGEGDSSVWLDEEFYLGGYSVREMEEECEKGAGRIHGALAQAVVAAGWEIEGRWGEALA